MMKSLMKSLMKQDWFHGLICWLIAQYLRLVFATSRWDMRNLDMVENLLRDGAVILITWHNRIAMSAFAWDIKAHPLTVLASDHRDGRLVMGSLSFLGINSVSIPQKKTAATSVAVRQAIKLLKKGDSVVITPDGPRGPRYHMKDGALSIARLAKVPMVMVGYGISRRKLLKSWDKFILPFPFSRGIIAFEKATDLDISSLDSHRRKLEGELTKFIDAIDVEMGFASIGAATEKEIEKALKGKTE